METMVENGEDEGAMEDAIRMLLQGGASAARNIELDDGEMNFDAMFYASVDDARQAASDLVGPAMSAGITADRLHKRNVVSWVLDHQDEMAGDADNWHNLLYPFFKCNDYGSAMQIALAGLKRFTSDATLLGDAIRSAGQLGDWDAGNELLKKANDPDYRSGEEWSLAVYVKDYLMGRARTEDAAARGETYEEALSYIRGAKERISPMNDRLINAEAEVLIEAGRIEEARDLLEDAIFMDDFRNGSLNPLRHPVPQCCLTYLDTILSQSCDYDKIIEICDAGIRFAAEEEKSVSVGYFFYRKALAMDSQIISGATGAKTQGLGNPDYIRNALLTYSLASKLTEELAIRRMCQVRFIILCALGGIDDMDVDDYIKIDEG